MITLTVGLGAGGFLINPVIRHIGKISCSACLIDFSLLALVAALVGSLGAAGAWGFVVILVAFLASTVIAAATLFLIEQSAINLARMVVRRLSKRRGANKSILCCPYRGHTRGS